MILYEFSLLYNEVKWQSDEQINRLVEQAIKEKNKVIKKYNRNYEFNPKEYSYLKLERQMVEYKLTCLKEYQAIRNGEQPFTLPDNLTEQDIPILYVPEEKGFIKKLFKK